MKSVKSLIKKASALILTAVILLCGTTVLAQNDDESQEVNLLSSSSMTRRLSRSKEYVPISNFKIHTATNRGAGEQSYSFEVSSTYASLSYSNGLWGYYNNAVSIRTTDKINFSGVEKLSTVIDYTFGCVDGDHNAIYVSDSDKFTSNCEDFDWVYDLSKSGAVVGDYWSMKQIAKEYIYRETPNLTTSLTNGEHYLYIALHKDAYIGTAAFKIYSEGDNSENNIILHLTQYNLSILDPDNIQIYKNGVLENVSPASNVLISNPVSGSFSKSTDIYRNESVAISSPYNSAFKDHISLKGIVFCDSTNNSKTSELIPLSSDSFTLTPELIQKYSSYFSNNNIVIKPVYSVDSATVLVSGYDGNYKVTANNNTCTADISYKDQKVGTFSWTKSSRSNNEYLVGDQLKFTFTPSDTSLSTKISVDIQSGTDSSNASLNAPSTSTSTNESVFVSLNNSFLKITPHFYYTDSESLSVSPITTDEKASIRLGAVNGIRFYSTIDSEAIEYLNTTNEDVEYGTLIGPLPLVEEVLDYNDVKKNNAVDLKFESDVFYSDYSGFTGVVGSIVDIIPQNTDLDFVGRGYVKIGDTYYYSETYSIRSLKTIATAYRNDGYPGADSAQREMVDEWANY